MIPIETPLRLVTLMREYGPSDEKLRSGWRNFIEVEVIPLAGRLDVQGRDPIEFEAMFATLEAQGRSALHRLMVHHTLIDAYDVACSLGWVSVNVALLARPL